MSDLETEVGKKLFVRTNHGVVLTRAGEIFHRDIEGGMLQISSGISKVRGQNDGKVVTIGVLPNIARTHAPKVVAEFKRTYPEICVVVETLNYSNLLDRLRNGTNEFLVGRMLSPNHLAGLNFEYLYSESIVFAVRSDHPLATHKNIDFSDFGTYPILMPMADSIIRFELDKYLIRHGISQVENRIETISYEFVRAFMRDNDAIGCMPHGIISPELESGEFCLLDLPGEGLIGDVGMTFVADRKLTPPARLLADMFRKSCRGK